MRRWSRSRPLVVGLALVLILPGLLVAWQVYDATRQRRHPPTEVGDLHAGIIPGFGDAWLVWSGLREGAQGLVLGRTNSRRAKLGASGADGWRELRVEREPEFRWSLRLEEPAAGAGFLGGVASNRVTGDAQAFRLERWAVVAGTTRQTGVRFGRWGGVLAFWGSWPELPATNRVREAVTAWLRSEVGRVSEGFLHDSWYRTWDGLRRPSAANRWEIIRHWRLRAEGPDWISLEEERGMDMGPTSRAAECLGRTFHLGPAGLEEWRLGDLFRPDSGWLARLEGLSQAALLRMGATGVVRRRTAAGLIREDIPYVLLPGGVELVFPPFEAGSAGEGTYRVFLRAGDLEEILRPEVRESIRSARGVPAVERDAR